MRGVLVAITGMIYMHDLEENKKTVYKIDKYFQPQEITSDIKEFLNGGLKILMEIGVLTDFEFQVFYLHEVERMKQSEIVLKVESTIDKVKKVIPRVRIKLAEKSDLVKSIFCDETPDSWIYWKLVEEEAYQATIEKVGCYPLRNVLDRIHEMEMECLDDMIDANNFRCIPDVLEDNPEYKLLQAEEEEILNSVACKRWDEVYDEENEIRYIEREVQQRKLYNGFTCEEICKATFDNFNILKKSKFLTDNNANNREDLSKLWGYIQIYWMKLNKIWLDDYN